MYRQWDDKLGKSVLLNRRTYWFNTLPRWALRGFYFSHVARTFIFFVCPLTHCSKGLGLAKWLPTEDEFALFAYLYAGRTISLYRIFLLLLSLTRLIFSTTASPARGTVLALLIWAVVQYLYLSVSHPGFCWWWWGWGGIKYCECNKSSHFA